MFTFLRNYKARKQSKLHQRGFEYAAGQLLISDPRSYPTAMELLEMEVDSARICGNFNHFDCGILFALEKAKRWRLKDGA